MRSKTETEALYAGWETGTGRFLTPLRTYVPAILSCQDCFSALQPAQKKPINRAAADKKLAKNRTIAIGSVAGWPSVCTRRRPKAIPPIVAPLVAHIAT